MHEEEGKNGKKTVNSKGKPVKSYVLTSKQNYWVRAKESVDDTTRN